MASDTDDRDSMLISILQKEGNVQGFLEAVYGFLYRRTDYFRILRRGQENLGFLPGVAMQMTLDAFKKYQDMALEEEHLKSVLPTTSTHNKGCSPSESDDPLASDSVPDVSSTISVSSDKHGHTQTLSAPDCYNGAVLENYSWSQTISDVEVKVPVLQHVTRGKHVRCEIKSERLSVSVEEVGGGWVSVMDGALPFPVKTQSSMWTLDPGRHVLVTLEKKQERFWPHLLDGETEIDMSKVDNVKSFMDLEDEAKMKIEQMVYDEEQKRLGKPTSKNQKIEKMLKEAWDVEGSPFKGQPFQPSLISMSGNTMRINSSDTPIPAPPPTASRTTESCKDN